ncbi:adenosine kinase [Parabacteroides pacaensis]|uniref:adenosine kinase n=1 Tax=Parabacteroides pacaensis TaxID=2086575 RepID=UPI000D0E5E93|nr:adenosine kinase [Parabacteroides pacaensis]
MKTIGLGNALVDVLLRLDSDEVLKEVGIEKGAMDLIDRNKMLVIRKARQQLESNTAPGGSVSNSMRAMARLGAHTGYIGKTGTDELSDFYEEELRKAGVTPHLIKVPGETGSSTVLISPDGERTMATYLGPAADLVADELQEDIICKYNCIYIEGYLIVNGSLLRRAMELAKQCGLLVALDLANFHVVRGNRELLHELVPKYVDILFCNESEAEAYTGQPAREAILTLSKEVQIAIVTLGKEGALIAAEGQVTVIPVSGGKPVDTTGAGDHFAAGFLYGFTRNATIEQSGRIGSLLAGNIIDVIGAKIPDERWEQIKLKVNEILA